MPPSRQVRRAAARSAKKRSETRRAQGGAAAALARVPRRARIAAAALVVAAAAAVAAVTLGSSPTPEPAVYTGSGYPNGDTSNTRDTGGPIDSATVTRLREAWSDPLAAKSQYGAYSSSPVLADGVIYSEDLASNVQALSLRTGRVLWTHEYNENDQGPNGLVVQGGMVYGATQKAAFALDERTGAQVWSVELLRNEHEGIDMAPGYHDGIVYVSTVPGNVTQFYAGEGVGILWALDARTGRKLWHFDTVPEDLWGDPTVNSGGGVWFTPAFDAQGNVYIGTGNPAPTPGTEQYPWGSSRPGPDLYTDSIVKLDARTGRLEWYYQLTPHDLYDWDLQDPPILTTVHGRRAVITAGKGGIVIALDAATGRLLWKTPVGTHNGHDRDGLYAMHNETFRLSVPETVYPGQLGGVIAPLATNGPLVFAPVDNHSVTFPNQTEPQEAGPSTGELVALEVATGTIRWTAPLAGAAYGAATVVNDLVFTTASSGKLYAFDTSDGHVAWETQLPAGTNTGVAVSGDTVLAPAGLAQESGQSPELVAYRLPGGGG